MTTTAVRGFSFMLRLFSVQERQSYLQQEKLHDVSVPRKNAQRRLETFADLHTPPIGCFALNDNVRCVVLNTCCSSTQVQAIAKECP